MKTGPIENYLLDAAFLRWLAEYGFGEYLMRGRGFFLARDPFLIRDQHGNPAYNMAYVPLAAALRKSMPAVKEAVRSYDPMESVVFVVYEDGKPLLVTVMGAKHLGVTPKEAYRAWCVSTGRGRLIPGEVVYLAEAIEGAEGAEEGLYVFLTREGARMTLRKAFLDGNANVKLTNDDVTVHVDFAERFSTSPGEVLRLTPVRPKRPKGAKRKSIVGL
jgi:hypothetical protein